MAHHVRWLSEPLPETEFSESSLSSSKICLATKPPSSFFEVFKSACFPVKFMSFASSSSSSCSMANGNGYHANDASVTAAPRPHTRKKNAIECQRRQELEQEVADLRKVLENEEKLHEVLERALLPKDGRSPLHIPSFLPKKTKELLAELVMVEEEISRLESEIDKIKKKSSNEFQEVQGNKPLELVIPSDDQLRRSLTSLDQPLLPPPSHATVILEEKVTTLETKPMFFINQAIKGDYSIHGFAVKGKSENITDNTNKKENQKTPRLHEINSKKSGAIEKQQSSPKPPRHSSPWASDMNTETIFKPSIRVNQLLEKKGLNMQPNKLSEKLMKCLLCIFLRLMRTSRVSDPEKSGTVSRSRSFRFESGVNLNSSLISQKETSQQDPYGILKIEDSLVRDIGPYKNLVRCTPTSFHVPSVSSSLHLLNTLRDLINNLREMDLKLLTHHQKLAFWINIYNACIMHGVLQLGLPSSPEKIIALKNKAVLDIGGNKLNAMAIEHIILRHPSNKEFIWNGDKNDKDDAVRTTYGLDQSEPNVTFALCCGTRSSPSVRIYTADGVSAELEKSKLEYLQASIVVTASKRLMIPKLLVANMLDFATDMASLVEWTCNQLPASGSLRKSIAECMKGLSNSKEISNIVDILPYDFAFQYLLPM